VDAGAPELPALRPSWRTLLGLLVALLAAGVALGQLQALLQGMHLSGRPAASIGGLNHLLHSGPDPRTSSGAVQVWKEYAQSTSGQGTADAYEVAWWAVAVDFFLFAPLYTVGLVLFFLRGRGQLDRWQHHGADADVAIRLAQRELVSGSGHDELHPSFRVYRTLAAVGIAIILIGFFADEVENIVNIAIVDYGWSADPNYAAGSFHALTWTLWIAGWLKWAAVVAATGLAMVLAWVVFAQGTEVMRARWASMRRQLHLLRMQLILVGLIAFVPFGHEQIPDLIRRWTPAQLALSVALAATFALTTWLIGRRLLIYGQWQPHWSADRRKAIGRILFWSLLLVAAIQVLVHSLSHGRYQPGWGLAIPAILLAGVAILGWLLPDPPPSDESWLRAPLAPGATHPRLPRLLAAVTLVAFGLGVLQASFGYSVYARAWSWQASSLIALALVAAGVLLAAFLGRELLIGAGLGAIAALVLLYLVDSHRLDPPVLVGAALVLILAGWRLYEALGADVTRPKPAVSLRRLVAIAVAFAVAYGAVVAFPFDSGERLGGVGILLFYVLVLTCAAALLVWVNAALHVPRALSIVSVKRFPILALVMVWFLAASWLDHGGYHNVRLKDAATPASGVSVEAAWGCWLAKNGLPVNLTAQPQSACPHSGGQQQPATGGAVPLILVATTGGGIRAAYWTELVLDCAFEVAAGPCPSGEHSTEFARSDHLFALSGISGGSLGLASYAAYLSEKEQRDPETNWVQRSLKADALSGSIAWWAFVEIPRAFLQFRSPTDRAGVLERGWERQWPEAELGQGLLQIWRTQPHQPLLLLNGTSVEDGCRFETSQLNANVETRGGAPAGCKSTEPFDAAPPDVASSSALPATRDLLDYLCNDSKDVRLSTAALLSARFPFVNPSARVEGRCRYTDAKAPVAYVVDGGYLDTSGASPIVELMTDLQPLVNRWNGDKTHAGTCIVPLMIQIDNGFAAGVPRPPRRPGELLVPLKTLFATRGARESEARIEAALLFSGAKGAPDHYAHFVNEAHPGPRAPLGWTQSPVSENELVSQLTRAKNIQAFEEVKRWLRPGGLTCRTSS
jgi:hypothetical protein